MNFKENDKLNREHYADFLIEILSNNKRYKRESDTSSFVMAIDSSWGTGKTTFLNMLKNKMLEIEDNNYVIINYNAWKSDAWKNPFETLMCTILEDDIFNIKDDINNLKSLGKDLKEVAKVVGKGFIKKQTEKILPKEIVEEIDKKLFDSGDYKKALNNISSDYDFFKEYKEYCDSVDSMKKKMKEICEKKQLIIFIDELDRCRPHFAIELLEVVKHLFDVDNMIFVFALDINQLSYSVQSIYGTGIDSAGYLCRFFDYISKLPRPNTDIYIDSLIKKNKLINHSLSYEVNFNEYFITVTFASTFKELANLYNLSLRDINTIYSNFLIFERMELIDSHNLKAYQLYLLLMIMKYKDVNCFNKLFIRKENVIDELFISNLSKLNRKLYDYEKILRFIEKNQLIKDFDMGEGYKILRVNINEKKIEYKKANIYNTYFESLEMQKKFSDVLFYKDILNWEKIKELHIKDFLHRKLEMFDFSWNNENDSL